MVAKGVAMSEKKLVLKKGAYITIYVKNFEKITLKMHSS